MGDPFDSPADRWGFIFYNSGLYRRAHTRQEWAQLADAMTIGDLRHRDGVRGDNAWCATAADTFTRLHDADAYADLRADDQPARWHADERLIRAWLGAPSVPVDRRGETVLHNHGWNHTLDPSRVIDPADLGMLVDLAQDAGVVGEPWHKVNLLTWVQDEAFSDNSFLVLVSRPDGPALPSGPVHVDELTGTSPSATDRAVAVLSGVAAVANRLLTAAQPDRPPQPEAQRQPLAADAVHEQPVRHGGRAFRLVSATTDTSPPTPPPPPSPPAPSRHPHT